ncbi:hypothetical protein POM88_008606 [Heracleum sosnowskyi]|uniref:Uncharacterized protein n=1 Tax=Heracleum sosnowskyi TaxID=360622 RepID=A0AAD8J911_9APIA|nr:hypothetical protein POM88_008606 [Heracleum sosnowskyi]
MNGNYVDIEAFAVARWCWPINGNYHPVNIISGLRRWKPGLKVLAKSIADLNIETPAGIMYSNWEAKELSVEQIEYACFGVYACFRIGRELFQPATMTMMNDGIRISVLSYYYI